MTAQTTEAVSPMTVDEATGTLNGYEEIAIEKHFGHDWMHLGEQAPMTLVRALIFVIATREGANAPDAKDQAMRMPLSEVMAYFTEDEAEDDRDPMGEGEVTTEAGKDNGVPA